MVKKEQRATKPRMKVGSKVQYLSSVFRTNKCPIFHHFPKGVSELLIPNGLCMVFGKVWTYTHAWAVTGNPAPQIRVPGRFSRFTNHGSLKKFKYPILIYSLI